MLMVRHETISRDDALRFCDDRTEYIFKYTYGLRLDEGARIFLNTQVNDADIIPL